MTEVLVERYLTSDEAVIIVSGAVLTDPHFRLRDVFSNKYLSAKGWTKVSAFVPATVEVGEGEIRIRLSAPEAARISAGMKLSLEESAHSFKAPLEWPRKPEPPTVEPEPEPVVVPENSALTGDAPAASSQDTSSSPAQPEIPAGGHSKLAWPAALIAAALLAGTASAWWTGGHYAQKMTDAASVQAEALAKVKRAAADDHTQLTNQAVTAKLELTARITKLTGRITELNTDFADLSAANGTLQQQIAELQAKSKSDAEAFSSSKATLSNRITDLVADKQAANTNNDALTDQVSSLSQTLVVTRQEVETRNQTIKDVQAKLAVANARISALKLEVDAANGLSQQQSVLSQQVKDLSVALAQSARNLDDAQQRLSTQQDETAKKAALLDAANQELDTLRRQIANHQNDAAVAASLSAVTAERDALKQQVATLNQASADAQHELAELRNSAEQKQALAETHATNQQELTALTRERDTYKRQADALTADYNDVVRQLTEARQGKDTPLAHGNVGNNDSVTENRQPPNVGDMAALTAERDRLLTQVAESERNNADISGRLQTIAKARDDLSSDLDHERKVSAELQARLDVEIQTNRDLSGVKTDNFSLTQDVATYKYQVEQQQQQIAYLQTQAQSANTSTRAIWGGAAYSLRSGVIYTLQNQTDQDGATKNIMNICKGASNGPCKLIATFPNACFAVARIAGQGATPNNWSTNYGPNWQSAESGALQTCRNFTGATCTIRLTGCSPDNLSKPDGMQ